MGPCGPISCIWGFKEKAFLYINQTICWKMDCWGPLLLLNISNIIQRSTQKIWKLQCLLKFRWDLKTSVTNTVILSSWYINAKFCDFYQRTESTPQVLFFMESKVIFINHKIFSQKLPIIEIIDSWASLNDYNKKWLKCHGAYVNID